MYSQWQAAWRSALTCGIVLLPTAFAETWPEIRSGVFHPSLIAGAILLAVCTFTLSLALAFRLGIQLAALKAPGLTFVAVTSAIYLALLAVLATIPIQTHAVALDYPPASSGSSDSVFPNFASPVVAIVLPSFVLPALVAYAIARIMRGRASAA